MHRWPGVVGLVCVGLIASRPVASARSATAGAIEGRVTDAATGAPLADVTIAATADTGTRTTHSGRDGTFRIIDLVPGTYTLIFTDGAGHIVDRHRVRVDVLAVTQVVQAIDRSTTAMVEPGAIGMIDPASTTLGFVLDRAYLTDLPARGRTFDAVITAAPGGLYDGIGPAFRDATAYDNRYLVDGLDTTDPRSGARGTFLPTELLDEVSVITGGASPEYGRSPGGLIAAATRSGTNALHGSVFAAVSPSALQASATALRAEPQTIDVSSRQAYDAGLGFTLAGPIIKDHVWFFVGFAPQLARTDYTRNIQSRMDCRKQLADHSLSGCSPQNADGLPDVDPATGFDLVETIDSQIRSASTRSYPAVARLDLALPQHRATLTAIVAPSSSEAPGLYGPASTGTRTDALTSDVAGTWVSRLRDDSLELQATIGWHRARARSRALDPASADQPGADLAVGVNGSDFGALAALGGESAAVIARCTPGPSNRYPLIDPCPFTGGYATGGPGLLFDQVDDRRSLQLSATDRFASRGIHELEAGVELEDVHGHLAQVYSGGSYRSLVDLEQFVQLASPGDPDSRFDQMCGDPTTGPSYRCAILGGNLDEPGAGVDTESLAAAGYVRDTWHVRSNLVIDEGLRYETQRLRYAGELRGSIDPITGTRVGDNALALRGNLAPRGGITYDPTDEGRAKLFAHWGRYFETMPTDVVARTFSTVAQLTSFGTPYVETARLGVDPNLGAGYYDEVIAGGQYEPIAGLVVGAAWQHRRLGRAIEDVLESTGYVLANPGVGSAHAMDAPVRDYDAVELTAARRFSSRLYLQASYVYSRTAGNYTGTIDYDDADPSPSHTSPQFDTFEAMANRSGPLPQDRPHYLKLDAAYTLPITDRASVVIGARFRALSGVPEDARAFSEAIGADVFLLPRGAMGRTDTQHSLDLHVAYRQRLARTLTAELYVDVFNVYDHQGSAAVDEEYTQPFPYEAAPISGGAYSDLVWLKARNPDGSDSGLPAQRNPHFGQPTQRYAPTYGTIGARLSF